MIGGDRPASWEDRKLPRGVRASADDRTWPQLNDLDDRPAALGLNQGYCRSISASSPNTTARAALSSSRLDQPTSRLFLLGVVGGFTSRVLGIASLHANAWDLLDLPDVEETLDALPRPMQHYAVRA